MNPETATAAVQQTMRLGAPNMLWWLVVVPLAPVLFAFAARSRRRARQAWAGTLFARLTPSLDAGRERWRFVLYLLGYTFVVLALARPQWGGETVMMKRKGIDVLIGLDTSNSMLAEDMRPNRLASAKRAVADLVQRMGGDRVGLLAFAGEGYVVCPLTLDHGTVLLLLDSMNSTTVSVQGTNLEDAIRRARAAFVRKENKHKALVLVTDGESTSGDPVREAQQAAEEGVVIYTIGIGSPDGQPIPERDDNGNVLGYKRDRAGQVVNSRLDEGTLQKIADVSRGKYYRVSAQGVELNSVFTELQSLEKKELEGQLATHFEERYQWPLALALAFLALEMVVPAGRRKAASGGGGAVVRAAGIAAALLLAAAWMSEAGAVPRRAVRLNRQGNEAYDAKKWEDAAGRYDEAQEKAPESAEIAYNLGNALYRQGKLPDAVAHLRQAAQSADPALRQQALYNLGNALHDSGQLEPAAEAYRQAMRLDPHDRDAKINYEKTMLEMQKGQGDKKPQWPEYQDDKQNQKDQQQQGQSGEQQQQGQDGEQQQSGQDGQGKQENPQQGDQESRQANEEGSEQKPQPQPGDEQQQQLAALDSVPGGLTREEALRILEAMREQEKELQQQRAQQVRARSRRVDKDW